MPTRNQYVDQIVKELLQSSSVPICPTILRQAVEKTLEDFADLEQLPSSPDLQHKLVKLVAQHAASMEDCGDNRCLVCRVVCTVKQVKGPPPFVRGIWREALDWLLEKLLAISTSEEIDDTARQMSKDAMYMLSWMSAQARVAEELISDVQELTEVNERLRATIGMLGDKAMGKN